MDKPLPLSGSESHFATQPTPLGTATKEYHSPTVESAPETGEDFEAQANTSGVGEDKAREEKGEEGKIKTKTKDNESSGEGEEAEVGPPFGPLTKEQTAQVATLEDIVTRYALKHRGLEKYLVRLTSLTIQNKPIRHSHIDKLEHKHRMMAKRGRRIYKILHDGQDAGLWDLKNSNPLVVQEAKYLYVDISDTLMESKSMVEKWHENRPGRALADALLGCGWLRGSVFEGNDI